MKLHNFELAFELGCLLLGLRYLLHGLVRLPKLPAFRAHVVQQFASAPLPPALVGAFATALPLRRAP